MSYVRSLLKPAAPGGYPEGKGQGKPKQGDTKGVLKGEARGKPKKGKYRKYTTSVLFFSATKKDLKYLCVFRRRGNVQDVPEAWRQ